MAIIYVRSTDGNDADSGATWALAKATLAGAFAIAAAGDTIYVSQAHSETATGAVTLTSPGTFTSPLKVICASDSAEPPTATATSGLLTVNANAAIDIRGYAYFYGLTFKAGTGNGSHVRINGGSTSPFWLRMERCVLWITTTSAVYIQLGQVGTNTTDMRTELINCDMKFGATSHNVRCGGSILWRGGSVDASGSIPTYLLRTPATNAGAMRVEAVDLSALGSGKSLVNVPDTSPFLYEFVDCKLGASVTPITGSYAGFGGPNVVLTNCDSSDTNYRYYRATAQATEQHETTIVRTGGASDGTTTVSRKIVTTANVLTWEPYETLPVTLWVSAVSTTISIPVLTDGVTLTDADAWVEVEYLGTSGTPLGVIASDRVSDPIFGTAANQTTDSTSTWTTTGLSSPVKQTLSVTFTPQKAGLVRARVCVAKVSTTIYYDPKILSTSGRQYLSTDGVVNEGASSSGSGYSRGRVVNN